MGNNNKGSIILLTVISVATLLVAVVGATFAYFNVSMNGKNSDTTIEVTNGSLSTEFNDNSSFDFGAAQAGTLVASKTFTINGLITGSSNLNYEVDLKVNNNTYADGTLSYTIVSTNDNNNGTIIAGSDERVLIPSGSNTVIIGKGLFAGPLPNGAIHTYTINIYTVDGAEIPADAVFDAKVSVFQATK
jgi:adhesin HecA-like repeat protein